ncbi:hypothetical protein BKG95_05935 [Rodentibacter pneumotropicus]|uniref:Uncharacterized protein n=1 Tax=Rodentibacter pneumotropicus TaxID=758 RepID=A0AAW5LGJ1_9PAST|nr:hypothetical protein [Rodentibacter pneumotropicus]MCQ9122097.1 hypothetical protein [Rodentibacter pneumotropicus]OOF67876.1 hypothetical protein BKG95_05935 [Rodentibacter pneumotropicus]
MLIPYSEYYLQFRNLIDQRENFEIIGIPKGNMKKVCEILENYIESQNLKCRIYTKNRTVSGFAGVINPVFGAVALVGIGIHNMMTWNPDFEISRDLINNRIAVAYKK